IEFSENYLHPFPSPRPLEDYEDVPLFGGLPDLLRSLHTSLGLDIRFVRSGGTLPNIIAKCFTVRVEGGKSPGCLVLLPPNRDKKKKRCLLTEAQQTELLNSLCLFLGDTYRWQQALRKYEEESAAHPPLSVLNMEMQVSVDTLFSVLKEGAKILGCAAASFYSLNSVEKTLKLRSCWGLPEETLLAPPRSLKDSPADLEAILGQAVVLYEDYVIEVYPIPEDFPAAVCVPVTSPMSILGTLWFFSSDRRKFYDRDIRFIEIIAGRIAAELERTSLIRELQKKN
ncbi:MAG: GAF domain-containing protein, partial [Planctomycetaceae bacterium]|nr:GAF domain-containing protein [Planctomycetaceae bacterium]